MASVTVGGSDVHDARDDGEIADTSHHNIQVVRE
jgi:hypothetical protein